MQKRAYVPTLRCTLEHMDENRPQKNSSSFAIGSYVLKQFLRLINFNPRLLGAPPRDEDQKMREFKMDSRAGREWQELEFLIHPVALEQKNAALHN